MLEDLLPYLWAFLVGGAFCVVAQILIDRTRLTPARILVLYVVVGVILGGIGLYRPLVDFAGAGATTPLTGFGYLISKGVRDAVDEKGLLGALTGGLTAAAGGITAAIQRAKANAPHTLKVEVEVESIDQAKEALSAGADIIMLDNMSSADMKACVTMIGGKALTEASGNMGERNLAEVAKTGVDFISIGALTHSVKSLDISLKFTLI